MHEYEGKKGVLFKQEDRAVLLFVRLEFVILPFMQQYTNDQHDRTVP
jgi:hypothetical protein